MMYIAFSPRSSGQTAINRVYNKNSLWKKTKLDKSKGEMMFEVLFDYENAIYYKFLPNWKTLNKEIYLQILCNLSESIIKKCIEKSAEKVGFCFTITLLQFGYYWSEITFQIILLPYLYIYCAVAHVFLLVSVEKANIRCKVAKR